MKQLFKHIVVFLFTLEARVLLLRKRPRIIAITGSAGKTSTKDAIYSVIKTKVHARKSENSFNLELGVPFTILGLQYAWHNPLGWLKNILNGFIISLFTRNYPEWLVLEIGVERPGDIARLTSWIKPDIVVLTRLPDVPVHVEFFSSPEAVSEEKKQLVWALKENGVFVFNSDDPSVVEVCDHVRQSSIGYSRYSLSPFTASADKIVYENGVVTGFEFTLTHGPESVVMSAVGSLGVQHAYNFAAAAVVGSVFGISIRESAEALRTHVPLAGRMRLIPGVKETRIIDDSYSSSPGAVERPLQTLKEAHGPRRKIAVLNRAASNSKFLSLSIPPGARQFVIGSSNAAFQAPGHFVRLSVGSWTLAIDPGLPVIPISHRNGKVVGVALGTPIANAKVISRIMVDEERPTPDSIIRDLAGRYVVLVASGSAWFSVDIAGTMAAVYSAESRTIASTPSLLMPSRNTEINGDLSDHLGIPERDSYYPFNLTYRKDVFRIPPGHILDADTFKLRRFWTPPAPQQQIDEPIDIVARALCSTMAALADVADSYLQMTAGRDARILLAAARPVVSKIRLLTIATPDITGAIDVAIARNIARRHRLNHEIIQFESPAEEERLQWLVRTGHSVAGRTLENVTCLMQLDPHRFVINGLSGEVGRKLHWWKRGDLDLDGLSPEDLLARMRFRSHPQLLEAADDWLQNLPFRERHRILDAAFIEQRLGCWAGPSIYGHLKKRDELSPFASATVFDQVLRLPVQYRFEQRLAPALIERMWPDLMRMPFNQPTPLVRTIWFGHRVAKA